MLGFLPAYLGLLESGGAANVDINNKQARLIST